MEVSVNTLLTLAPVIASIIGVYVNLNSEIQKLRGRVYNLEQNSKDLGETLKELVQGVNEIKLLLAREGFKG